MQKVQLPYIALFSDFSPLLVLKISQQQVCEMPHLFDSNPFASLAMTSVHARRARNAYVTHQDPSEQSTNSAQHPPIIFYDVM